MTLLQRLLLLALCFVLSACNEMDLYTKLTERQANEMVAALQGAGIEAAKSSKDPGNWVIQVARDDFGRAVETLRADLTKKNAELEAMTADRDRLQRVFRWKR